MRVLCRAHTKKGNLNSLPSPWGGAEGWVVHRLVEAPPAATSAAAGLRGCCREVSPGVSEVRFILSKSPTSDF